jgi:hypothetical protein
MNPLMPTTTTAAPGAKSDPAGPLVFRSRRPTPRKVFARLTQRQAAREALAPWTPGEGIVLLTKGQFTLVQLLEAVLAKVGPANVTLSAWVATPPELDTLTVWVREGRVASLRLILDLLVQSRDPEAAALMRHVFGDRNVALTRTHARFALIETPQHRLVVRTSADLTNNPSFELHSIEADDDTFLCLSAFADTLFDNHEPNPALSRLQQAFRDVFA